MSNTTVETLTQSASNLTHELRNTLTSTKMAMNNIKTYLPILIETYKTAKQHQLTTQEISDNLLNLIEELIHINSIDVNYAGLLLNLFSSNLKNYFPSNTIEKLSIKHCLQMAFSEYPYRSEIEKTLLNPKTAFEDFAIYANLADMRLIFSGLIHNILSRTAYDKYGVVDISYIRDNALHKLLIKDHAEPLHITNLNHVFERFSLLNSTQAGLFYCKQIMESIAGDINCQLENGQTVFLLTFPVKEDDF